MTTKDDVREVALATAWNPVKKLAELGVRSGHAYTAGFAAVGLSMLSWMTSRGKGKAQADRWGLFVGEWAPTFFALGLALKHEEG
jgi:hypothetical protein